MIRLALAPLGALLLSLCAAGAVPEPAPVTPSTTTSSTTSTSTTSTTVAPERHTARVSWYGSESGSTTANGEAYNPAGLTFAHKTMRFGTMVEFCRNGRCVVARCNDRGPFVEGRTFDLSAAAFAEIAPPSIGVAEVTWAVVR